MVKYVVFDFDGTVADSYDDVVEIINELGMDVDFDYVRKLGIWKTMKKYNIPFWKIPALTRKVLVNRRYSDVKFFLGMVDVFRELNKEYRLGILSSNNEANIRGALRRYNVEGLFDFVYSGSSLFGKDRVLKKMCLREKIDVGDVVYVGDEDRDVLAAKKVGMRSVGVSWGFNSRDRLVDAGADFVVDRPSDLVDVLRKK